MITSLNRKGTWRTYSMFDGLAGRRIEHIAEDSEGYLWFASWDNGVSRFDGDEFQHFTRQDGLISDRVYFVSEDSQNRLWFGTLNGVCWYDGADFHHLGDDGIAGRAVQFIYEDSEGRIWCGGHRTLGYYDGTAFRDLIPLYLQYYDQPPSPDWPNQCRGIAQDSQGHLWFGFNYLICFDGQSFHRYEEKEGFPRSKISYAVGQDDTGKVWVGQCLWVDSRIHQDKLWCYTDGNFEPVQVDLGGFLRKIQCDREGRMWFSSLKSVLYQDGDGFSRFNVVDGLPHSAVKAVLQDREHQFWFATWGGVGLYDAHSIGVFDLSAELSIKEKGMSEISQIVQDRRGDIWIGYISSVLNNLTKSIFRFDGKHVEFVGAEDGFDINNCFAIYEDHGGDLWFGGRNGLFRYDGQKLKKISTVLDIEKNSVCAIAQDSQGQFLFGHWKDDRKKRKRDLFSAPLELIYQRGEQFQTIFVSGKEIDTLQHIGAVIAGHSTDVYFHLNSHDFINAAGDF